MRIFMKNPIQKSTIQIGYPIYTVPFSGESLRNFVAVIGPLIEVMLIALVKVALCLQKKYSLGNSGSLHGSASI